jgi:hypothetical protein
MEQLAHDLPSDQSAIYMDGDELIMLVLRDFCPRSDVVNWVDDVVRAGVQVRKSVRVCVLSCGALHLQTYDISLAGGPRTDLHCWVLCRCNK